MLVDETAVHALGPDMEIFADQTGRLTIDQVATPEFSKNFTLAGQREPGFGITRSVIWGRITLNSILSVEREWFLVYRQALVDRISVYVPRPDGGWTEMNSGMLSPTSYFIFPHRYPVFPLGLQPAEQPTLYIRMENRDTLRVPLVIQSVASLYASDRSEQLLFGALFGILMTVCIYLFFIWRVMRERCQIFLILMQLMITVYIASTSGFLSEYLWSGMPWMAGAVVQISILLVLITGLLFGRSFVRSRSPDAPLRKSPVGAGGGAGDPDPAGIHRPPDGQHGAALVRHRRRRRLPSCQRHRHPRQVRWGRGLHRRVLRPAGRRGVAQPADAQCDSGQCADQQPVSCRGGGFLGHLRHRDRRAVQDPAGGEGTGTPAQQRTLRAGGPRRQRRAVRLGSGQRHGLLLAPHGGTGRRHRRRSRGGYGQLDAAGPSGRSGPGAPRLPRLPEEPVDHRLAGIPRPVLRRHPALGFDHRSRRARRRDQPGAAGRRLDRRHHGKETRGGRPARVRSR